MFKFTIVHTYKDDFIFREILRALERQENKLNSLTHKINNMTNNFELFKSVLDEILADVGAQGVSIANIEEGLAILKEQITGGGMSADQEALALTTLTSIRDNARIVKSQLQAIADAAPDKEEEEPVEEPIDPPPPPPPPVEEEPIEPAPVEDPAPVEEEPVVDPEQPEEPGLRS